MENKINKTDINNFYGYENNDIIMPDDKYKYYGYNANDIKIDKSDVNNFYNIKQQSYYTNNSNIVHNDRGKYKDKFNEIMKKEIIPQQRSGKKIHKETKDKLYYNNSTIITNNSNNVIGNNYYISSKEYGKYI